jgi:hypothetical protein
VVHAIHENQRPVPGYRRKTREPSAGSATEKRRPR